MRAFDPCRPAWAAATLVTVGATVLVGTTVPAAVAAPPSITFQDPGSVVAGEVELRGVVTTQAAPTTTVLYLVDVSQSTKTPSGVDCDADGVAGGAADNLNGDTGIGDTLDCEIGAIKAINAGLVASAGRSLASLETFAGSAAPVNLVPGSSPATLFVAPGAPGAGGQPAIVAAAAALRRDPVPGTSYDPAVTTALNTLRGAPAGPKYIMLLTDGGGNASSSTVNAAGRVRRAAAQLRDRERQGMQPLE